MNISSDTAHLPIRIGVSSCLLGEKVRYNGGHTRDDYVADTLNTYFEWVPLCPELEVGMGVPRESVHLVEDKNVHRMLGIRSDTDWTDRMVGFSQKKVRELETFKLSGYIFKKGSPSCGIERIKIYNKEGQSLHTKGIGLFARVFMEKFPHIPVEEEGRLNDARIRDNFIVRVFAYHRWLCLIESGLTAKSLVRFHTIHKLLLMAHSHQHYTLLGRLISDLKKNNPGSIAKKYISTFMEGLALQSTTKKNYNVLLHIWGYIKKITEPHEKTDLLQIMSDYKSGLVPLVVPITLLYHYIKKYRVDYILDQIYLKPHPKEMMLRNHV